MQHSALPAAEQHKSAAPQMNLWRNGAESMPFQGDASLKKLRMEIAVALSP
jgi:hypothetical protein